MIPRNTTLDYLLVCEVVLKKTEGNPKYQKEIGVPYKYFEDVRG